MLQYIMLKQQKNVNVFNKILMNDTIIIKNLKYFKKKT